MPLTRYLTLKEYVNKFGICCDICGKSLDEGQEYNLEMNHVIAMTPFKGGMFFIGFAMYGSKHDCREYVMLICDDCIDQRKVAVK